MLNFDMLAVLADECGFTYSAPLDISTLEFLQEVRDMCNPKQCDKYNKSWSCPPACASLEDMRELVRSFDSGLLVQTVGDLEDSYDWEGIMEAGARHKENFGKMRDILEEHFSSVFAMGAGACSLCESCTYPDAPCRFPERMSASMEACGLFVSKVCTDNNLKYNYGQNKIAFNSCFLFG
jgi:predicted metal-binding protein